ncbi:hypothetical protein QFC19_000042 [Naganishia cerealis]|uniref:Uncharacterized protein n=1 Tax=Naganishia cerealis TaxID=610337 RepID=A0ACC2WRR5_9TREE|nr:hypothetical protein QFC19_000042 [Naganishia cerealis]
MFRLLKDALAAPSPPSPPQARRSSTTTSKADQPAERVTDPDVEEMKRDSKEDDWEVKRVISAVKEWADADEGNHVHSLSALDALLSQLQQLIRLPETEGHVTTPVADFPSTLRIRQTMFRKEGGFESFLKAVDKVSKLEVETQAHLSDIAPQIEAVKELKLEDAKDSVQTPEDGEGTQQEQEVSPVFVLSRLFWSNLFKTQAVLPSLYEAVLTRLYGPSSRKREESKMAKSLDLEPALRKGVTPGREKEQALPKFLVSRYTDNTSPGGTTHTGLHQDDVFSPTTTIQERGTNDVVHQPADQTLRPILLKLLRRLVEAGVPVEYAYMLYRLAKKNDAPTALAKIKSIQAVELGLSTQNEVLSSTESSPSKSPSGKRTRPAKPMNLKLALNVLAGSAKNGPSVLDKDVLEILRHGSSRRWPDMFMFSPGLGGCEGGLSCSNLGKTWPTSAKGFYFMAWVYVEHLCGPITLLHVYETKRTLLRVRILPNSQVGVIASRPEGNQEPLEEVIFSGSDSLVPHQKWIHIALAGRQPRTPASSPTEVKLLINGRRTQAMKCEYPKPTSMANQPGAEAVMVAVGKDGQRVPVAEDGLDFDSLGLERSTWFLGHSMLLGEYVGDDLALLLYYLGPRYQSNMREALGRFLTCKWIPSRSELYSNCVVNSSSNTDEGATALNIYLHNMVHTTKKEGKAALPANSYLIKAIKQGHIFPEEAILFSYSANNVDIRQDPSGPLLEVPNAALPSSIRLNERKGYHATVQGDVKAYNPMCLDEAMFVVGGPAVALKLVELASSPDELQSAITLLSECVKESWKASEEAERMRKPVNFKVMGKALALRFDLWARAPVEVLELYFAHFQHLLTVSRFKRFNVLHCLKKAGLVRRLLHALKANTFDSTLTPQILGRLSDYANCTIESLVNTGFPVLSYLIASLCSNSAVIPMSSTGIQPSIAQATAISVYQVLAQILESSMNLTKLVTALPLHRVLIVILSSNPFAETISISLAIFKSAITHSPHEQFEKRFSAEGGYDLFARLLPANWSTKIQDNVFAVILDEPKAHISPAGTKLIFGIIFTALERLMQIPEEETPVTPKPVFTRARSATSHISLPAVLVDADKAAAFYPKSHRNAIPRTDELNSAASYIGTTGGQDPFAEAMGDAANQAVEVAKAKNDIQHEAELPMVPGEDEDDDDEDTLRDVPEEDGKKRRIAEMLATGDVVEDVSAFQSDTGLLIIGKQNLYLFDGLAKTTNGDIVTADEAPSDLFSIPSGTIAQIDIDDMQSHSWNYNEIVESHKRWYLFRDVAIEFLFADKRNFLCVLRNKKERQTVLQRISGKNDPNAIKQSALGTFLLDTVQKAMVKAGSELDSLTRRWQTREISNFAYLQVLNQFANRTPNDVTQYPVFPWVVADYTSPILNLSKPSSFRDLSLPMGALTPDRREAANERYLQTESTGDSPFQFGTHYSSSMIGGSFDLADRLFSSVAKTWASASEDNRGDVRELIPELYYSPLMLLNLNHHQFGKKQVTEEDVDDVELPPWALGNALLFTHRLREALESDYVSRHLPSWIDLVFGFKQHDKDSFTCYHPLSYKNAIERSIDLDAIENEAEKAASVGIIHNFGQTPYQIFKEAHPHRYMGGKTTLPAEKRFGVAEHWMVLMRSALPVVESATPIRSIVTPPTPEFAPSVLSSNRIPFPEAANVYLHFGNLDKSIRKYHVSGRLYGIVEYTDACLAVFVNAHLLATTSERGLISLWKLEAANGSLAAIANTQFTIDALLRGHEGRLHHLEASDTWSTLVSCGEDGTAIVWDMNRKRFLHRLLVQPEEPVKCAAISESEVRLRVRRRD